METVPEIEEYVFTCPFCEAKYTAGEMVCPEPEKESFPNPDADDGKQRVIICVYCCTWGIFYTEDSGRLNIRKPDYDELIRLMTDPAVVHSTLKALVTRELMRGM